jgi:hypothetical protein
VIVEAAKLLALVWIIIVAAAQSQLGLLTFSRQPPDFKHKTSILTWFYFPNGLEYLTL